MSNRTDDDAVAHEIANTTGRSSKTKKGRGRGAARNEEIAMLKKERDEAIAKRDAAYKETYHLRNECATLSLRVELLTKSLDDYRARSERTGA